MTPRRQWRCGKRARTDRALPPTDPLHRSIKNNGIFDEGAKHFCAMLKENKTLTTLECAPPARACAYAALRALALAVGWAAAAAVRRTH